MSELSDGELIQHFCSRDDQAAFAELIARHSAMVLAVARSVVGEASAAEDIAQATFVTFAKKVGSLDGERSCAGWLHHVAVCLARNARRGELRRAAREQEAAMIDVEPDTSPTFSEALLGALHEELAALSETYRVPVILHHIEGLSYEQAAAAIGCNVMTFGSNLTRAREKLRKRLTKRGVTLGAMALVTGLSQSAASAAELPVGFVASTCAAAKGGVVSAKVAALTESALKMLFWAKVQTVAAICAVTLLVAGSGVGVAVTVPLVLKQDAATATKMAQEDAQPKASGQGGRVWAWGDNGYGQLGDGTKTNRAYPTPIAGLDGVIAVSVGGQHTVALKSDRTVWTWGGNSFGQLGDGTMNQRSYPAAVAGLSVVTAIAAARGGHTLALKADGGVWAWGNNRSGQLGIGTTNNSPIPVPVKLPDGTPLTGVMALAAGWGHSVALRNDGSVWTWGANNNGQLGDGTTSNRLNPVLVKLADGLPLSGVRAIDAGDGYTVALKSDGTFWAWGFNMYAQLGDGTTINRLNPTPVNAAAGAPFIAIAAGSFHAVALKGDATVWAWGLNHDGVLGDGTRVDPRTTPTPVRLTDGIALSNVTAVAAGASRTLALKIDGTLVAWGKNPNLLDVGVGTDRRVLHPMPVKLADGTILSKVIAIAAGAGHSVAIGEE